MIKVKFKGSEVGYSLSTIESLLQRQGLTQSIKESKSLPLKQDRLKQPQNNQQPLSFDKQSELKLSDTVQQEIIKAIDQLIKPEETPEPVNQELLRNEKQKKKKHRLHL